MYNLQPGMRVEVTRCNLCGQDDVKRLYRYDQKNLPPATTAGMDLSTMDIFPAIVKCRNCGLVYVNPRWRLPEDVMPYSQRAEQAYFEQTRPARIVAYDHLVKLARRRSPAHPLRFLDVGCGDGLLLERSLQAGLACDGFEVSPALIQALQAKFGAQRIFSGDLGSLPAGTYDCAFLVNVIEHLPDPQLTLQQIQRLLLPGGRVFVHAPNLGGLPARLQGRRWHHVEPLAHLYYFNHDTLAALLSKAGFSPEGDFYLKSDMIVKNLLQWIFNKLGWHVDNGLGVIGRKAVA